MKVTHYGNEVRVKFTSGDPEWAVVSVTFPGMKNQYLYLDKTGQVHWYDDKDGTSMELGSIFEEED